MSLHFFASPIFQLLQKGLTELDPAVFTPLEEHLHKTVCIHLHHFPALHFIIEKDCLKLCEHAPSHIDVTFEGSLTAFLEMIFSKKAHTKGLHIRGDMDLAKALYDTWQYFDWNFESQLAKIVGDTLAHTICQSFTQGKAYASKTYENRKLDIALYLQNEQGLLITPLETEEFFNEVSQLRDDVERFAAKINSLLRRLEQG
jgi:ubiquinone biosynthesis protein UbiJ